MGNDNYSENRISGLTEITEQQEKAKEFLRGVEPSLMVSMIRSFKPSLQPKHTTPPYYPYHD